MSQYIASFVNNSYLPQSAYNEGQKIPIINKTLPKNKWRPQANYKWEFIKDIWTQLLEENNKSIFIEASPPNMIHVQKILQYFNPKHFLFSISSPYSFIGSQLYNYKKNEIITNELIDQKCKSWVNLAEIQISNISNYCYSKEIMTYEKFCSNPDSLIDILFQSQEEKDFYVDKTNNKGIMGKDNDKFNSIVNMQPKHLAFLGLKKINYISKQLEPHKEVLDFFDYKILTINDVNNIIKDNLIIALDGIERRTENHLKLEHQSLLKWIDSVLKNNVDLETFCKEQSIEIERAITLIKNYSNIK